MSESDRTLCARALLGTMPLVNRTIGRAMRVNHSEAVAPLLPQQYRLLGALSRKRRTLGQVALIQGVTPATATTLVTTLEGRGWVERVHDHDDRRKVYVSLTDHGREVLAASQRVAEAAMSELLAPLSEEQIARLLDGLQVLRDLNGPESAT